MKVYASVYTILFSILLISTLNLVFFENIFSKDNLLYQVEDNSNILTLNPNPNHNIDNKPAKITSAVAETSSNNAILLSSEEKNEKKTSSSSSSNNNNKENNNDNTQNNNINDNTDLDLNQNNNNNLNDNNQLNKDEYLIIFLLILLS